MVTVTPVLDPKAESSTGQVPGLEWGVTVFGTVPARRRHGCGGAGQRRLADRPGAGVPAPAAAGQSVSGVMRPGTSLVMSCRIWPGLRVLA